MAIRMGFTDTEKICKYCYEHHLRLDSLDAGNCTDGYLKTFDLDAFRKDKLSFFSKDVKRFPEDDIIPEGFDVMVLRQARYMPIKSHTHEYLEFVYLMEGTTTEVIDGKTYTMEAGDLFLLAPGTTHYDVTFNDDALLFFIMARARTFDTAFHSLIQHDDILSTFFSHVLFHDLQDTYILLKTAGDEILKRHIYELFLEFESVDSYTSRIANVEFEWLCIHLLQKHIFSIQDAAAHQRSINMKKILFYAEENYRTVTLDDICRKFSYSRGHLQRIIKKNTGSTFSEFVAGIRIRRSCELLKNQSLQIHDIADAVGFHDDSSFFRCFKKQMGISPSAYRKQFWSDQAASSASASNQSFIISSSIASS